VLHDPSADDPVHVQTGERNAFSSRGHAQPRAFVRTSGNDAGGHPVAFGNLLIYEDVEILRGGPTSSSIVSTSAYG
jgi:hypothetical protein